MELRFVNGHWEELKEDGVWRPVDKVDEQWLEGYNAISVEGSISGPKGVTTLDAFMTATNPIPEGTDVPEGATGDLSWWPAILPKFKPSVTALGVIWSTYSAREVADIFQATMTGNLPNEHLDGTKWEEERDRRTAALGASEILSEVFDSAGQLIPGKGIRPNGDVISFIPSIDVEEGTPGIDTVTPVIDPVTGVASDFVVVAVSGQPPKYLRAAQAPEPPTIADMLAEAVAGADFNRARKLGRIINQPQTMQALITSELEKGSLAGNQRAQQIFDFANQTTKEDALKFALEVARSPADTLAWSALVRGELRAGETPALSTTGIQRNQFVEDAFDALQAEQRVAAERATTPTKDQPVPAAAVPAPEGVAPSQANLPTPSGASLTPPRPAIEVAPQINQQPATGLDAARVAATQAGAPGQAPTPPIGGFQGGVTFDSAVPSSPTVTPEPVSEPPGVDFGTSGPGSVQAALARFRLTSAAGTPQGAAVTGDPQFRTFGQVETPQGTFEDVRVAPRVADVATGRTIGRPDFNRAFREIGIAIGIGPDFRPPSFEQFNRLTTSEQQQLLGAAQIAGISPEEFMQAIGGATPGGLGQRTPRLGVGGRRGLA